jgi:serine/threonine protein kinase
VKVIYRGISFEPYGEDVHRYLASKDMAPKYYFSFHIDDHRFPKDAKVLEYHHLMEYLPPPSHDSVSAGWISLLDLEEKYRDVASHAKEEIKAALYDIITVLQERNFVHGDLRPNNLLISIKCTTNSCSIQSRPNSVPPLPYLKVIDFDWAGLAGVVEYPPHRNPDVQWPGSSGKPIMDTHDKIMIDSWLSKWSPIIVPDVEEEKEDRKDDDAPFLRISHRYM